MKEIILIQNMDLQITDEKNSIEVSKPFRALKPTAYIYFRTELGYIAYFICSVPATNA